ncbi:MAG: hypothetical protein Q8O99_01710 [bacterium]|nr:hypothetical protein [bacterium]
MSSQKASHDEHNQMHQLETELNGYAGKRIRQILLRKSLTTLLDVFDFHDKEAVPLSEKMQVDLSKMELDSDSHSLKYPVRYGSFGTLLMLDGQTGDISIESMLDKMN